MMRRRCFGVAGLLAVALVAGSASAPTAVGAQTESSEEIELTRLMLADGTPLSGGLEVNERGQVLASYSTAAVHVWQDGETTLLNVPPWEYLAPLDISNQGHVVGRVQTQFLWFSVAIGAFAWKDGQFAPINPLWDDSYGSEFATSVNDSGQVVMWFRDWNGARRLAVLDAAGQTTLAPEGIRPPSVEFPGHPSEWDPWEDWDWRSVINEGGKVAFNMDADDNSHAAIWNVATGQVTDLGTLGGDMSTIQDINGQGMVTGTSTTAEGEEHAFLWSDDEMTDLGTLGGGSSAATDINEWGQIIGTSTTEDGEEHGFVWYDGEMAEIEPIGGNTFVFPAAINNWGQVVGTSTDEGSDEAYVYQNGRAFLWQNGRIASLGDATGGAESEAVDINDRGQILGSIRGSGNVLWSVSSLWGYGDDAASDLAAARKRWDENRPDTYRVTITQSCFCPPEVVEPRTVTVEGDEVTDVDPPIPGGLGIEPLTIDALFDVLERAVVEADELNVSYNEVYGFPESISIDWIELAVDDEISYSAQSFGELVID